MATKKPKLNKADFMFAKKDGETLIKKPGDINGIMFSLKDLNNCEAYVLDHTPQIFVDRCTNCKFYIGPVSSTIFFRDCKDCEITVACG